MPPTTDYAFGDVVLVAFPFTDQTTSKKRPAVIVSSPAHNRQRPVSSSLPSSSPSSPRWKRPDSEGARSPRCKGSHNTSGGTPSHPRRVIPCTSRSPKLREASWQRHPATPFQASIPRSSSSQVGRFDPALIKLSPCARRAVHRCSFGSRCPHRSLIEPAPPGCAGSLECFRSLGRRLR